MPKIKHTAMAVCSTAMCATLLTGCMGMAALGAAFDPSPAEEPAQQAVGQENKDTVSHGTTHAESMATNTEVAFSIQFDDCDKPFLAVASTLETVLDTENMRASVKGDMRTVEPFKVAMDIDTYYADGYKYDKTMLGEIKSEETMQSFIGDLEKPNTVYTVDIETITSLPLAREENGISYYTRELDAQEVLDTINKDLSDAIGENTFEIDASAMTYEFGVENTTQRIVNVKTNGWVDITSGDRTLTMDYMCDTQVTGRGGAVTVFLPKDLDEYTTSDEVANNIQDAFNDIADSLEEIEK